jgi:hypothetical protein
MDRFLPGANAMSLAVMIGRWIDVYLPDWRVVLLYQYSLAGGCALRLVPGETLNDRL